MRGIAMNCGRIRLALVLGLLPILAACGGAADEPADPESEPVAEVEEAEPEETPIQRMEPTPTPTVDAAVDPLAPIGSEDLEGVVVPAGAELVEYLPAGEGQDALASYRMAGVDSDQLYTWFRDQMQAVGWDEPEDKDGALIFLKSDELAERHADLGQRRTATLILSDVEEAVEFSLIVEQPD